VDIWNTLLEIMLLLLGALALGALAERLKQSAILGYLLAGTLLGPHAFGLVKADDLVNTMAELGVALLLFSIGLEFSFRRLRRLGPAALGGGGLQVLATMLIGAAIAMASGLTFRTAVAIGAIIALSSTASVLRVLLARAEVESFHGRLAIGILLMQDLAVVPLVLLLGILGGTDDTATMLTDALKKVIAAGALIGGFWILFNYLVPWLLGTDLMRRNRELPILLAIVAGLGSAIITHKLDLSASLGAFIVGLILAESPFAVQIRADISALRTLLLTLFFSSIGLLGDPQWAWQNAPMVILVVAGIVIGKAAIIWIILRIFRIQHRHALAAGIALAQAGEFSFVLAAVAMAGALIDEDMLSLLVTATIVTLFVTPYLVAGATPGAHFITEQLARLRLLRRIAAPTARSGDEPLHDHIILIGFGPAGQAVAETLMNRSKNVAVIDLNHAAVRDARRQGFHAHYGDATHADVLEHVHAKDAAAVVITIPDPASARRIILLLRTLEPSLFIIARARYHIYRWELEHAGADVVLDEEQQLGTQLAAELHQHLGGSYDTAVEPEQSP